MKKIDKPLYEHLGEQLKAARLRKGYSLQDVADFVGKSKVSIKRYEDASVRIDMDTLDSICFFLGVNIKEVDYPGGDRIVTRYLLVPNEEEAKEHAETKQLSLSDKLYEKFLKLDKDSQRIVLMMLKVENVDEVLDELT